MLDHREDLLDPEAAAELEDDYVAQALLTLLDHDDIDLGFAALGRSIDCAGALTDVLRRASAEQLQALAVVCYASADRDDDRAIAVTHIAIGLAMRDQLDAAIEVARDARRDHDASSLVRYVTNAISQRPEHAVNLASLIRTLTEPEPPASD